MKHSWGYARTVLLTGHTGLEAQFHGCVPAPPTDPHWLGALDMTGRRAGSTVAAIGLARVHNDGAAPVPA